MIPSRSLPFAAKAVALFASAAALLVTLWVACGCCCPPRVVPAPMPAPPCSSSEALPDGTCPAPSWSDYVKARPWARDLDPAVAHPAWRGVGTACGAGKCE